MIWREELNISDVCNIFDAPKHTFEAKVCVRSIVRLDNGGDDGMLSWKPVEE